jgi:hypothetical protein
MNSGEYSASLDDLRECLGFFFLPTGMPPGEATASNPLFFGPNDFAI